MKTCECSRKVYGETVCKTCPYASASCACGVSGAHGGRVRVSEVQLCARGAGDARDVVAERR